MGYNSRMNYEKIIVNYGSSHFYSDNMGTRF